MQRSAQAVVVAAVDFSDACDAVCEEAARIAKERQARIVLVHAVQGPPRVPAYGMSLGASPEGWDEIKARTVSEAQALTQEWARRLLAEGLDVDVVVQEGAPEDLIIDTARAEAAALIVVGSHGWKGFKRFVLGSVAQSVLHDAHIPVLVVPVTP